LYSGLSAGRSDTTMNATGARTGVKQGYGV
jgi:hypothetical protein